VSPKLPKKVRPWQADPGHIVDVPGPPPMPDRQGLPKEVDAPAGEAEDASSDAIEVLQSAVDERPVHGEPAPVPEPSEVKVPRALATEIRKAMKRYPEPRSASIPALWAVQRRYGWCTPEGIEQAAAVMGVTPGYLQSVASFYDLFHLEPRGDHEVLVCTNISCWLRGGDDVLAAFKEASGDDVHVTGFECLGACDIAPMASVDERYYGPLEPGDAATIVDQLAAGEDVLPAKALSERGAAGGKRAPADKRLSRHAVNKPTRPRPKRAPKTPVATRTSSKTGSKR
jgi:NADH:ubiquinone oxidoreductase subunit E